LRNFKKEFEQFCIDLQKECKTKITVITNPKKLKKYVLEAGVAYPAENPPRIILTKSRETSYKDLIMTLAHEYGHILDYKRYKKARRWKLYFDSGYENETLEKASKLSKNAKYSILHTEYIAEKLSKKLIKKYGLESIFDSAVFDLELAIQIKISKYEFMYGKHPSGKITERWKKELEKKPEIVTLEVIKNLDNI
jgi:hypothetical protein